MEANSEEKQLYIKENVTNKGYDSFLFTQFICKKYNQKDFDINKFSIGQIREAIQDFKNNTPLGKITNSSSAPPLQKQKKKNIIQSILGFINEEEQKSNSPKKSEFDYGFRLPEKLKCQNVFKIYDLIIITDNMGIFVLFALSVVYYLKDELLNANTVDEIFNTFENIIYDQCDALELMRDFINET